VTCFDIDTQFPDTHIYSG